MIAIIDYEMGNLRSVQKAFETVGCTAVVTRERRTIEAASHVVLPGVGAFADCMANLERYDLVEPIRRSIAAGKPFLGICLGLQLLFSESEEFGLHKGLDLLAGRVRRFADDMPDSATPGTRQPGPRLKVPHMGWNRVRILQPAPILAGLPEEPCFYFVHSYYVEPADPAVTAGVTEYGSWFTSVIWRENLFATQFHPEKSQASGLRLLANFAALAR